MSGRGAVAMWGYPLWLFLGLWIVMFAAHRARRRTRSTRIVAAWAAVFAIFVIVFVANYAVLPLFDHRYRAVLFPGDALGEALTQRFHAATGAPLRYVIGTMWDGGNLAHYSPDQPQVLIDGEPHRAPWIDLGDLRKQGRRRGLDARRHRDAAAAIRRGRAPVRRSARRSICRCAVEPVRSMSAGRC